MNPTSEGERDSLRLSIRNVSRNFKTLRALRDVSLDVEAGQVHVLLGHNGAGKTTLIRIILGLIRPTSGTVSLFGEDPWRNRSRRGMRQRLGVLFEPDSLYEDISAWENLEFFARIHRLDLAKWEEATKQLMEQVGLYDRRHERVVKWSAGMKRKLAILRALQHQPEFVLLDEPTAGLDVQSRGRVRDAIQHFRGRQTTFLIASQDLSEVQRLATHVTLLREGRSLYSGTLAGFYRAARLRRFHGSVEDVRNLLRDLPRGVELVREESDLLGAAVVLRLGRDVDPETIRPVGLVETPVLMEDIYLELDR